MNRKIIKWLVIGVAIVESIFLIGILYTWLFI